MFVFVFVVVLFCGFSHGIRKSALQLSTTAMAPCVGIGAASIDLEGAASEGAASMPAPPGVAVGISSKEEVVDNGPSGVSHKDKELEGAASIELGGAASMPAPPVGGADAVDMGGGGCTMAGGAAALGVPPSGAVRGSAFSCSTSSGAAPGGHLGGHRGRCWGCWGCCTSLRCCRNPSRPVTRLDGSVLLRRGWRLGGEVLH